MANQYTSSFAHIVQENFGKSAKELLIQYAKEKITYDEAAKITGFTIGTIRKWCTRYQIYLSKKSLNKRKPALKDCSLLASKSSFKKKEINLHNALSRQWLIINHDKSIC